MSAMTCPICQRSARPRAENRSFPFCSERCKAVDLGRWLNEEYRVPALDTDDTDMAAVAAADRELAS